MKAFDHLLLTRFNVRGFLRDDPPDAAWLTHRLELFERFCLPSVRSQTTRSFRWLVLFDESTGPDLRTSIESWARQVPLVPCFVGAFRDLDLPSLVAEHADPSADFVITTRLDNDDAICRDFLERVQEAYRAQGPEFINLDRGYVLADGKLYPSFQPSNPFLSLIEPRKGMRTVWQCEHKEASLAAPVRRLESEPAWLQVVHGLNTSNRPAPAPRAPITRLYERFEVGELPGTAPESRLELLAANVDFEARRVARKLSRAARRAITELLPNRARPGPGRRQPAPAGGRRRNGGGLPLQRPPHLRRRAGPRGAGGPRRLLPRGDGRAKPLAPGPRGRGKGRAVSSGPQTRPPGDERPAPRSASVIVPVLDGVPTLADQLAALAAQDDPGVPWEVVVADNGSRDASRELALRFAGGLPELRLVDASSKRGSSHARNVGALYATGELLCFCDADDVVSSGWLAAHVAAAPAHDLAGGPLEVERLNPARVRRWRPTPRTAVGKSPASFAPSGNMSIWAEAFAELGGFDEGYLKSHDVELGQRARAAGLRLGWVPEADVHYRYRSSLAALAHQAFRAGRAGVQMALDHPRASPLPTWGGEIRAWAAALVRIPALLSPQRRGAAVRLLAQQAGRLQGIVRYRKGLRVAARRAKAEPETRG